MRHEERILVTGATGLIGGELVRALSTHEGARLWALVRPLNGTNPTARLLHRLKRSGPECDEGLIQRVEAVSGEMPEPWLGLAGQQRSEIAQTVDVIIQCASETSCIRDNDCRRTNIDGIRNLIQFARACAKNPLVVYLGTA